MVFTASPYPIWLTKFILQPKTANHLVNFRFVGMKFYCQTKSETLKKIVRTFSHAKIAA